MASAGRRPRSRRHRSHRLGQVIIGPLLLSFPETVTLDPTNQCPLPSPSHCLFYDAATHQPIIELIAANINPIPFSCHQLVAV